MSACKEIEDNQTNSPHVNLAAVFGVFLVKFGSLVVAGATTNSINRLVSKGLFAKGPVDNPDSDGVLTKGGDHDVAGFEVTMYDSFLDVGLIV